MLERIESGHPYYGRHVGVIVFSGTSPRVPGDPGHAETFDFPVDYEVVDGCFARLAARDVDAGRNVVEGARRLRERGVGVVAGDCGLMGAYQDELGSAAILAAGSSLCLIPTIWHMVGRQGVIGVITGHSGMLGEECLRACGCTGIPLAIRGLEDKEHFREIVIEGGRDLDVGLMEREVVEAALELSQREGPVRAIVLECSNLATYARAVARATGLPTFDIDSAVRLMEQAMYPPAY